MVDYKWEQARFLALWKKSGKIEEAIGAESQSKPDFEMNNNHGCNSKEDVADTEVIQMTVDGTENLQSKINNNSTKYMNYDDTPKLQHLGCISAP